MSPNSPPDFFSQDTACRRCGECCRRGGPILHVQDLEFVDNIRIARHHLVCLRQGEIVSDPGTGKLIRLQSERLKLRGADLARDNWRCVFYSQAGCELHPSKPLQCRLLDCARPQALLSAYAREALLERKDLITAGSALAEVIAIHEERFAIGPLLNELLSALGKGESKAAALRAQADIIDCEQQFRQHFAHKAHVETAALDFFFGRPLALVVKAAAGLSPGQAAKLAP